MYHSIFLIGFRATGKSTIGLKLAQKLGWEFLDTDELVKEKSGTSINNLTKNGTNWLEFRQLEHNVITELLHKHNIVVGVGGGAPVTDLVQPQSGKTFGELNATLFKDRPETLTVLLTADEEILEQRMREFEMASAEPTRPPLDKESATRLEEKIKKYEGHPEKQKEIVTDEIIKNSMEHLVLRKPLYAALTDKVIDTGKCTLDDCVEEILKFYNTISA